MPLVEPDSLKALAGSALFYPGAGSDYNEPLELFAPAIAEYWFVDISYFTQEAADDTQPLITSSRVMEFERFELEGPPIAQMKSRQDASGGTYPFLEPCTRSEFYTHRETNSRITVHWRRGFGQRSICLAPDIGVFFHRGDSLGEGGSNTHWLSNRWISDILGRLRDGGLVVTDGSLAHVSQIHKIQKSDLLPECAFEQAAPFEKWGRLWTCVGWAGSRNGPTLIWKLDAIKALRAR